VQIDVDLQMPLRRYSVVPLRRCAVTPLCRCAIFITFVLPIQDMAMESTRQKKVAKLIQKEMADIFLRKSNEIAHGKLISITMVRISPDLSFAKIFLSIFPPSDQDEIMKSIEEHTARLRFDLGHKIRTQLRIVPDIAFFIDDSLDYIDNIEKLLKK